MEIKTARGRLTAHGVYLVCRDFALGHTLSDISRRYAIDRDSARYQIKKYGITIGGRITRKMFLDKTLQQNTRERQKPFMKGVKPKYNQIEEPINIGKTYREYLKECGLKVPKGFWGKI